jgi:hypothetical protein
MKYYYTEIKGKLYAIPRKSIIGFLYGHRDIFSFLLKAILLPFVALPFMLPVLIYILFIM